MANEWLRLWHDMPNDPKWRTIARISCQPLALVQAVYLHLLVDASRNVTRGHVSVTSEDLASALDVTEDAITSILAAMEGRVMEAGGLSGWDKRQPKREDTGDETTGAKSAAQRKREQRERERQAALEVVSRQSHDESREVTLDKDKDKDKEEEKTEKKARAPRTPSLLTQDLQECGVEEQTAAEFLALRRRKGATLTELAFAGIRKEAEKAGWTVDAALKKCITRGWQSFEAEWVQPRGGNASNVPHLNRQEALEASNQAIAERALRNAL